MNQLTANDRSMLAKLPGHDRQRPRWRSPHRRAQGPRSAPGQGRDMGRKPWALAKALPPVPGRRLRSPASCWARARASAPPGKSGSCAASSASKPSRFNNAKPSTASAKRWPPWILVSQRNKIGQSSERTPLHARRYRKSPPPVSTAMCISVRHRTSCQRSTPSRAAGASPRPHGCAR